MQLLPSPACWHYHLWAAFVTCPQGVGGARVLVVLGSRLVRRMVFAESPSDARRRENVTSFAIAGGVDKGHIVPPCPTSSLAWAVRVTLPPSCPPSPEIAGPKAAAGDLTPQ